MKQFFAGCVVVLVAAVGVQFASSATSTSSKSIPARVKALEVKVKGLAATLKALQTCLGAQGVTQFGNPAAGQGYLYTNDGGTTVGLTTGFDAPPSGQTPSFYAATLNPACVSSSHAFRLRHVVNPHTTLTLPTP
jgi:hypothetical protein